MVCELRAEGFQADHGFLDFCFTEQRGRTAQEDSTRKFGNRTRCCTELHNHQIINIINDEAVQPCLAGRDVRMR